MCSIKYIKSKNQDEDNTEGNFDQVSAHFFVLMLCIYACMYIQLFQHQLLVNNTRFSWTFVNRSIITNLFDAYTKAQVQCINGCVCMLVYVYTNMFTEH